MLTLVANRYVCRESALEQILAHGRGQLASIDTATGGLVRLRFLPSASRDAQRNWEESCVRHLQTRSRLIDFGVWGSRWLFEAEGANPDDGRHSFAPGALDWLEALAPTSRRVLYLPVLPSAREIRLRGFVPVGMRVLSHLLTRPHAHTALRGRSIVVLDHGVAPGPLEAGLLLLRHIGARDMCALVRETKAAHRQRTSRAAEKRAVYSSSGIRRTSWSGIHDSFVLERKGRHAQAHRMLRAAFAARDRRADDASAAQVAFALGELLAKRGRTAQARAFFAEAEQRFQKLLMVAPAIRTTVQIGICLTDGAEYMAAEDMLRAAQTAACAGAHPDELAQSGLARARNFLCWGNTADAAAVFRNVEQPCDARLRVLYWSLAARLQVSAGDLDAAWEAINRARRSLDADDSSLEALLRSREAEVQSRLGDIEALTSHVRAGLLAARRSREPLRVCKLRLTLAEGLLRADRKGDARTAVRHLLRSAADYPLRLRHRIDRLRQLMTTEAVSREKPAATRETSPSFHFSERRERAEKYEGLIELLEICQDAIDDRSALAKAVSSIRRHTAAAGTAIYSQTAAGLTEVAADGKVRLDMAKRSIETSLIVQPQSCNGSIDAAVPIRFLSRTVGALVLQWSAGLEPPSLMEFIATAGRICAPLIQALSDAEGCEQTPGSDNQDLGGSSAAMAELKMHIRRAANAPFAVLIEGESGVGKELVARAIHRAGNRRERRFCPLNCAAMPEDLLDAEMFGHAKGAFTGASNDRAGLFESAEGGTVFLDEVAELSPRAQAKLLRVLQENEVRRLGETFTRPIDTRIIAATNRPLGSEVGAGRFRHDLRYRLDVIRIAVPPLREHAEDVPELAVRFWNDAAARIGSRAVLGQGALSLLARYHWPGNVRELQNVLSALAVSAPPRGVVGPSHIPAAIAGASGVEPDEPLERARVKFEQRFVRAALARFAGHKGQAASSLGLSRQGLAKLMHRLNLDG